MGRLAASRHATAHRTGGSGSRERPRAAARGFTLIEILVVVLIVGVLAGIVVLGTAGVGVSRTLDQEAARLAALERLACEEAILSGRDIGLTVASGQYAFLRPGDEGPSLFAPGHVLAPRSLPSTVSLALRVEGRAVPLDDAIDLVAETACLASGELLPHEIVLAAADRSLALVAEIDGTVAVLEVPR